MFLVDTNVLVYSALEDTPEHRTCKPLVDRWRAEAVPWFTTWPILYEFVRVASHPAVARRPLSLSGAGEFVRALVASPGLSLLVPSERHAGLLVETVREVRGLSSNLAHDLATAVMMREHGIRRIVTHDADFRRFPFLEVVDPLLGDWPDAVRERPARYGARRRSPVARAQRGERAMARPR